MSRHRMTDNVPSIADNMLNYRGLFPMARPIRCELHAIPIPSNVVAQY